MAVHDSTPPPALRATSPASGADYFALVALVFAAIAPHGGLAIEEACAPEERGLAAATRAGMVELGRLFRAARPQAVVVATPHNVHLPASMGVVVSGRVAGQLAGAPPSVALDVPTEMTLAWLLLKALLTGGVPASGVSFGGNDPAEAVAPMDWGALIPLWFMGGRADPPVPLVLITPARDLSAADHIRAGDAVANAATESGLRVAFIASADHGHAHDPRGPYGFDPAAKQYDQLICGLVRDDHLDRLAKIPPALVESAKADSWWQMLMLHGATADGWRGRLISYEAPTYFGMLTAAYVPVNAPLPPAAATRPEAPSPHKGRGLTPGSASPPRKRSAPRTRER
jgi:aromatic ring-opening dioxygenase LigB subunit